MQEGYKEEMMHTVCRLEDFFFFLLNLHEKILCLHTFMKNWCCTNGDGLSWIGMKVAMVYIDPLRGLKYAVCRQTVTEKTVLEHFFPSVTTISSLQLNHGSLEVTDALKFKIVGHLDPPSRSKTRSVL